MTQQLIDLGSIGPSHLSESIRSAFTKVNDNFTEIFTAMGPAGNAVTYSNSISSTASIINLGIGDALTNGDTLRDAFIKIVNNFNTIFTVVPISHYNINLGSGPNTQTGDTVNSAFEKINSDFTNLYTTLGLTVSNVAVNNTDFGPSYRNRLNIETVSSEYILPVVTEPFGYYGVGQQFINLGDGPDTQTGDTVREAFIKINANFSDLYQVFGANGETNLIGNTIIANNINVTDTVRAGGFFGYGNLLVEGNVLGSNFLYANGISVFANLTADYAHVASNIVPTSNNTFTLGNASLQWGGAYLNSAIISRDLAVGGNLTVGGNIVYQNVETGNLFVVNTIVTSGNVNASYYFGNGRYLTGIDATSIQNGTSNVKVYYNSNVGITANGTTWTFDPGGTLTFPTGSQILNGYPGPSGSSGDGQSWFVTPSNNGGGIASVDGQQYVQVDNTQGVLIGTAWPGPGYEWNFGRDGNLTLPGNLITSSNVVANNLYGNLTQLYNNGYVATLSSTGQLRAYYIQASSGYFTSPFGIAFTYAGDTNQQFSWTIANADALALKSTINSTLDTTLLTFSRTTGNLSLTGNSYTTGNVTGSYFFGNGRYLTGIDATSIQNGTSNVKVYANANVTVSVANVANVVSISTTGTTITGNLGVSGNISAKYFTGNFSGNISGNISAAGANTQVLFNDAGTVNATSGFTFDKTANLVTVAGNLSAGNLSATNFIGNAMTLGTNTAGQLVSNAVTLTTGTSITNSIAQLNYVLGKLVPTAPNNFPGGQSLTISTLSTYRMTNFTQTDNTATGGKSVAGGTSVANVRRANTYTTSTIANVGPGDSGAITAYRNGVNVGAVTLTGSSNGTYGNLVITNNQDYHNVVSNVTAGFWYSFSASLSGNIVAGWNEVYIADSVTGNTNIPYWYYDSSAPGTPTWSNTNISMSTNSSTYSSTIPHLNSGSAFTLTGNVSRLSGDMFPSGASSSAYAFVTGSAGGALAAPSSVTYAGANITWPLAQNLYVSSGSAYLSTTAAVISGFGSSSTGPSLTADNSYATGAATFSPGVTILYKTGTANQIEETSIPVNSVGTGSGNALRVLNPGSTDTPVISGNTAFNSQTSTLQTYDTTIVAAVLKHDQTNYSTGYLPVGPNLSTGRTGTQYFTFKFTRTVVSKFDIKYTGTIAGLWVALPGSTIDTSSSLNGWLDMSTAYSGSGIPGVNSPGNGSNGCALGGVAVLNSAQTNKSVTATFGTVSSSSTVSNEIFVRVALTSGQTVTALTIETATH
jgi:hypothetical protein